MDGVGQSGNLHDKNIFAAQERAHQEALQAKKRAEEEERRRVEAERQNEIKRQQREAQRLASERRLQEETERARVEMERQMAEAEARKQAADAAERKRKAEQEERARVERENRERQERLAADRAAAEAKRQAEEEERLRVEAKRVSEEKRKQQQREAEENAERTALQVAEVKRVQQSIDDVKQIGKITRQAAEALYTKIWTTPESMAKVHEEMTAILRQHEAEQRMAATAASEVARKQREQEEAARKLNYAKDKSIKEEAEEEAERERQRQAAARAAAADKTSPLSADTSSMKDIGIRLLDPATRNQGIVAIHRYLVNLVSAGSMQGLSKCLESGFPDFQLIEILDPLAAALRESPGNVPAITALGLLGFCGHIPTYKTIRELHVIPGTIEEWGGWLIGCRVYAEYCEWACGDRKEGFKLTTEITYDDKSQNNPKLREEAREKIKRACQEKITQLVDTLGVNGGQGEAKAVEDMMERFSNFYLVYEKTFNRIDSMLERHEQEQSKALMNLDATKTAQKARAECDRSASELADLRAKLSTAESRERQNRVELQRLQEKADTAKSSYEAKRRQHLGTA